MRYFNKTNHNLENPFAKRQQIKKQYIKAMPRATQINRNTKTHRRQTDRQTDRQKDNKTDIQTDRQTDRQTDTDRQTNQQTARQTDGQG